MRIKNLKLGKRIASFVAAGIILLTGNTAQAVNNKKNYPYVAATYNSTYDENYKFSPKDLNYSIITKINTTLQEDGTYATTVLSTDGSYSDQYFANLSTYLVDSLLDVPEWNTEITTDFSFLNGNVFEGTLFTESELSDLYYARDMIPGNPVLYTATSNSKGAKIPFVAKITDSQYSSFLDMIANDKNAPGIPSQDSITKMEVAKTFNHEYDTGIVTTNYHAIFKIAALMTKDADLKYVNYRIESLPNGSGEFVYKLYFDYNLQGEKFETKTEEVYTMNYEWMYRNPENLYDLNIELPEKFYRIIVTHGDPISFSLRTENGVQKLLMHNYTTGTRNVEDSSIVWETPMSEYVREAKHVGPLTDSPAKQETIEVDVPTTDFEFNGKSLHIPNIDYSHIKEMDPYIEDYDYPIADYQAIVDSVEKPVSNTMYLTKNEILMIQNALAQDNPLGIVLDIGDRIDDLGTINPEIERDPKYQVYINPNLIAAGGIYYNKLFISYSTPYTYTGLDSEDSICPIDAKGLTEIDYWTGGTTLPFYKYTPRQGDKVITYYDGVEFDSEFDAIRFLSLQYPQINYVSGSPRDNVYLGSPFITFNIRAEQQEKETFETIEVTKDIDIPGKETFKDTKGNIMFTNNGKVIYYTTKTPDAFERQVFKDTNASYILLNYTAVLSNGSIVEKGNRLGYTDGLEPNYEEGTKVEVDELVTPSLENGLYLGRTASGERSYQTIQVREDGMGAFYYRFDAYLDSSIPDSRLVITGYEEDGTPMRSPDYSDGRGLNYDTAIRYDVAGTPNDYDFIDTDNEYDTEEGKYRKYVYFDEKVYVFPSSKDCLDEYNTRYQGFNFKGTQTKVEADDFLLGTFGAIVGDGLFANKTYDEVVEIMKPSLENWAKAHVIGQDTKIVFEQDGNNVYAKIYITNNKGYQIKGTYSTNKPVFIYSVDIEDRKSVV